MRFGDVQREASAYTQLALSAAVRCQRLWFLVRLKVTVHRAWALPKTPARCVGCE